MDPYNGYLWSGDAADGDLTHIVFVKWLSAAPGQLIPL